MSSVLAPSQFCSQTHISVKVVFLQPQVGLSDWRGLLLWVETTPMPQWSVCTLHSCQAPGSCCLTCVGGCYSPFILLWIELTSKSFCSSYLKVKALEEMSRVFPAMSVGQEVSKETGFVPWSKGTCCSPALVSAGRVIMGKPA